VEHCRLVELEDGGDRKRLDSRSLRDALKAHIFIKLDIPLRDLAAEKFLESRLESLMIVLLAGRVGRLDTNHKSFGLLTTSAR